MAGDIIYSTQTAVPSSADAVATLRGEVYRRDLHGITITGYAGSHAEIYLGAVTAGSRIDQTSRGQSNTVDYSTPRPVPAGTPVLVAWLGMAAHADACTATFAVSKSS